MGGLTTIGNGLNALQNAQRGINRGIAAVDEDAAVIARATADIEPAENLSEVLVGLTQKRLYVEASARTFSTADETLGTLLDTYA